LLKPPFVDESPLLLEVGASGHECGGLVDNPFADVKVLVDGVADLAGFDVLGLDSVGRIVS
jgi:hypothetical protein